MKERTPADPFLFSHIGVENGTLIYYRVLIQSTEAKKYKDFSIDNRYLKLLIAMLLDIKIMLLSIIQ